MPYHQKKHIHYSLMTRNKEMTACATQAAIVVFHWNTQVVAHCKHSYEHSSCITVLPFLQIRNPFFGMENSYTVSISGRCDNGLIKQLNQILHFQQGMQARIL